MATTYLTGAALDVVRTLPDASVDLVASSPPFLALRNYNGVAGQWGSEATPAEFLSNLLELTTELRRVLAPHGSTAIELGDTYSGSGGGGGDYLPGGMRDGQVAFNGSARAHNAAHWRAKQEAKHAWPLAKSLTGVPTLYAWSLAYGRNLLDPEHTIEPWRIRNVIVWARNNPPVGALGDKVRPATSYITVACPSDKRWFDLDAVRVEPSRPRLGTTRHKVRDDAPGEVLRGSRTGEFEMNNPAGAPPLDHWHDECDGDLTWLINTQGSSLAHYAMWPARLAERLILSMCPAQVCRVCGTPRRRLVEAEYIGAKSGRPYAPHVWASGQGVTAAHTAKRPDEGARRLSNTIGWSECPCADYRPGVTLDPFAGTGTTLHVAEIHGRDAIGIDLDPANVDLVDWRRDEVRRALLDVTPETPGQLSMLDAL